MILFSLILIFLMSIWDNLLSDDLYFLPLFAFCMDFSAKNVLNTCFNIHIPDVSSEKDLINCCGC